MFGYLFVKLIIINENNKNLVNNCAQWVWTKYVSVFSRFTLFGVKQLDGNSNVVNAYINFIRAKSIHSINHTSNNRRHHSLVNGDVNRKSIKSETKELFIEFFFFFWEPNIQTNFNPFIHLNIFG